MGISRFAGPVYGAKQNLVSLSYAAGAISSNASTGLTDPSAKFLVPAYEDWFLTECYVNCSTCSSNAAAFYVKVEPTLTGRAGGTAELPSSGTLAGTVFTITSGTSTSIATFATAAVKPANEYEGWMVPANSTIRIVSSGNSAMGITQINLRGFVRYIDSTRAV